MPARSRLLKQTLEPFIAAAAELFAEARLRMPRRLLALPCGRGVFLPSVRCRPKRSAVGRFTQGNAIRRLRCVRRLRWAFLDRTAIQVGQRLPGQVHTRWQLSHNRIKAIVSPDLRITETQRPQACGTSGVPEASSGMETIFEARTTFGTQTISGIRTIIFETPTIFGMATIVCAGIGGNTCTRNVPAIGIVTGTAMAITGGMVTGAVSSITRG